MSTVIFSFLYIFLASAKLYHVNIVDKMLICEKSQLTKTNIGYLYFAELRILQLHFIYIWQYKQLTEFKANGIISYTIITNKTKWRLIMKNKSKDNSKYMSSVKVGPKGQIVIPKEVRDMFGIESGDTLILLADAQKGIAIERMGIFSKIADAILSGKGKEIYPEQSEEDSLTFAKEIKKISDSEEAKE